jgi:hypothetical protein
MGCLTIASDELYRRYLELNDRVLGEDVASLLSSDEPPRPKARLQ